ncbi:Dbl homology domain-containing protein [Parasitella parasitica]|nr:Dbl homology domain-containing protein [Parasitella parasitica]
MEAIIDKVEKLEIDTSKWHEDEEATKDHLTSTNSIKHYNKNQDFYCSTSPVEQHKRSKSAIYDSLSTYHQSFPDLKQNTHRHSYHYDNKKKWFQLPRMTLKRQQSTPPRRGFGGLKPGLVEPPEPPPQLLFNLDWSTNLKDSTAMLSWKNDVSHSISTPVTPVASRRSSSVYSDILPFYEWNFHHKKSSSVSSTSTVSLEDDAIQLEDDDLALRRQSCPEYDDQGSYHDETVKTLPRSKCRKLLSIIPIQPLNMKKGVSTEGGTFQPLPSPSTSTSSLPSSSSSAPPSSPPLSKNKTDNKNTLISVYVPDTNELVLDFRNIQPRTTKPKHRHNLKTEQKALNEWQTQLLIALNHFFSVQQRDNIISPAKKARYLLTRRFILQEFYTTEITFWNQLNFSKVMFCNPLTLALERGSILARPTDMDLFANLEDLMAFSATLIRRLREFQVDKIPCKDNVHGANDQTSDQPSIGVALREMTEFLVTFLRCALDYEANKKLLDQKKNNKGYKLYEEKLSLKKETRQFTLDEYLIIPIQRVTRYGLLLTDLQKHTESTHPDYKNIKIALCTIQSLASAMNSAQH